MALAGIGIDILEIARMERTLARRPSFATRIFTEEERRYCENTARPAEHYAARFAAREAVLKALGCGFGYGVGFKDVSVGHAENGRPVALLSGEAARVAQEQGVLEILLSLSFTRENAVANAVLVTEEVKPQPKQAHDPAREFQASFREARTVIDELERMQDGVRDTLESVPVSAPAVSAAEEAEAAPAPAAEEPNPAQTEE